MGVSKPRQFVDPLARVMDLHSEINGNKYELRIRLPQTYDLKEKNYPLFVVLDAEFSFYVASEIAAIEPLWSQAPTHTQNSLTPEVIVVSVALASDPPNLFRRNFEFSPAANAGDIDGSVAKYVEEVTATHGGQLQFGGAQTFLKVLSEEIIPAVNREFRVDPRRSLLFGHSASGCFASFTLLSQPKLFTDYVIVSPGLLSEIFRMEAEWAENHDDLPARVLLTVGLRELGDPFNLVSKVAQFSERLAGRRYPSLKLTTWFIDRADHVGTAAPSISSAMKALGQP